MSTATEPQVRDVRFVDHAGEVRIDGKGFWPIHLRVQLDRARAWRLLDELSCFLRNGKLDEGEFTFFGDLQELPDDT